MHNNKKDAKLFAPYEVWTHDPQFTRLVLYHWAKGASYKIVATFSTLLFFCHHPCASSRQPTENISNQGLVNLFRYLNRKSFGYNCASRIIPHALKLLQFSSTVRLAEWSKAWDLSSHNRKIAWVRTPHLTKQFCRFIFSTSNSGRKPRYTDIRHVWDWNCSKRQNSNKTHIVWQGD